MPDRFRAAAAAAVDALFPPDPGALRLFAALRATLAAVLTLAVVFAAGYALPLPITDRVLGFAIALFAAASVHDATPRARLLTIALTPIAAFLGPLAAVVAAGRFAPEAFALLAIVFAATYGGARGARWGSLGSVALISYFFSVVSQQPAETLPARFGVLCVAAASVALVRFVLLPERPEVELARLRHGIGLAAAGILDEIADAVGAQQWRSDERARLRRDVNRLAEMTAMAQARQSGAGERLLLTQLAVEQTARRALVNLGAPSDRAPLGAALSAIAAALRSGAAPPPLRSGPSQLGAILDMVANFLRAPPADEVNAPPPAAVSAAQADSGLASAARATAAAALAIAASATFLPSRWYWAAFAAFAMFQGTRSRGESIAKELQYFVGTLSGVVVGMFAGFLLAGHEALQLLAIIGAVFLAFQASAAAYGAMMFWLTIIIGLMFGLLGYFVTDLLLLRLAETAIGSICGVAVGLIFPMRSALATRKGATKAFFEDLGHVVDSAVRSLAKPPAAADLPQQLVKIERAARDLRTASSQELYGLNVVAGHSLRVRLLVVDACEAWARELGRVALMAREAADERLATMANSVGARIQSDIAALVAAVGGPGREGSVPAEAAPPLALPGGAPDYAIRLLLRIHAALQHLARN